MQAEDGIRDLVRSRGLGDVYKRQILDPVHGFMSNGETKKDLSSKEIIIHNKEIKGNVYFDDRLVPHIYAEDDRSLYFLQGYITAQNRLWQMDIQTRAAGGRLSEIFGEKFIPYDLEQRRKGMVYAAEIAVEELKKDPLLLSCIQAYTCLLYTSPSPRDRTRSRMPSSA